MNNDIGPYPPRIIMILHPDHDDAAFHDWIAAGGWCRAVQARGNSDLEKMAHLHDKGLQVMLEVLAHPKTIARQRRSRSFLTNNPADLTEPLRQAIGEEVLFWQPFTEEDSSGVGFAYELLQAKPRTHAEALKLIETRIAEVVAVAEKVPHVRLVATAGFATTAHALGRAPFEAIYLERTNDDVDDLQTGVAFFRGAAGQYHKTWGIDLSLWWGPTFSTVGEMPASYHRRAMYTSYFAGADALIPEGIGSVSHQMPDRVPPVAQAVEEVGRFMTRHEAGEPDAPVAVMLPRDHGWMTPPYWEPSRTRWNYARIPSRPGDRGIDGFFGLAFPGSTYAMDPFPFGSYEVDEPKASPFALACITPEYAPSSDNVYDAIPPLPFGRFRDRTAADRYLHEHHIDPSPYRPMGTSRWGDLIDILTDDAPAEVLRRYPALVLLGAVPVNDELRDTLVDYVSAGGTLVASVGTLGPADEQLSGVRLTPEQRVGRAWRRAADAQTHWVHEPMRFVPAEVIDAQTTTVHSIEAGGSPLVVCHTLGRGRVWTCLTPWFEGASADLAGPAADLFDTVIVPMQRWSVQGMPIQWLSTRGADHRTLVLANHDDHPWVGRVRCLDPSFHPDHGVELITNKPIDLPGASEAMAVTVPPREVRVLRLFTASEVSH